MLFFLLLFIRILGKMWRHETQSRKNKAVEHWKVSQIPN